MIRDRIPPRPVFPHAGTKLKLPRQRALGLGFGGRLGGISLARAGETSSVTVYRVFGDDAQALGRSWTPINPSTVKNYRDLAGLPNVNTGRFVIEGTVKNSNITLIRSALPLDGNKGGLVEYIIENPLKVEIMRVSGVNPRF